MKQIIAFFKNIFSFCRHSDDFVRVMEEDYNRIHENHKLDPVSPATPPSS